MDVVLLKLMLQKWKNLAWLRKVSAVSDQLCFRRSRTRPCLRLECQWFNYHLCHRHPRQPCTSHDVSWQNLFRVCKIKVSTCCLPPLFLPLWMLHLPGQSCSPTWWIHAVLSMEGEGRAEIKFPLANTNCLDLFPSLSFTFFPCRLSTLP